MKTMLILLCGLFGGWKHHKTKIYCEDLTVSFQEGSNMCMMLYIASDKEIPLIDWRDGSENFICVTQLNDENKGVTKQFTKKYVYYIGSYQGCGCGFQYDIKSLDVEGLPIGLANEILEEQNKRRRSVKELFDCIKENIKCVGEMELYSCWAGNEEGNAKYVLDINLANYFLGENFRFEENQLIRVRL